LGETSNAECMVTVSDDAEQGDMVMLKATTRSGSTCNMNKWVKEACTCAGVSIGYATNSMQIGETQSLTASGGGNECDWQWACDYGSITSAGLYTAATTSPTCKSTITLSIDGEVCNTLEINIQNPSLDNEYAYNFFVIADCWVDGNYCYYHEGVTRYNCNGECHDVGCETDYGQGTWMVRYEPGPDGPCECGNDPTAWIEPLEDDWADAQDIRSEYNKTHGCCPEALM